jgi:hypothetical protein
MRIADSGSGDRPDDADLKTGVGGTALVAP